jgi:DNA-binding transcriptional regulator YiaG
MKESNMYHFTTCGLDNVYLKNGYTVSESESGKGVSFHDLQGLLRAIGCCILKKEAPLNGREFRFLRVEMDLSQKAIGSMMEKTDQTIANWEKGCEPVPALADKAIRDLYAESIETGPIAGLLQKLSEMDRRIHELTLEIELNQEDQKWHAMPIAC